MFYVLQSCMVRTSDTFVIKYSSCSFCSPILLRQVLAASHSSHPRADAEPPAPGHLGGLRQHRRGLVWPSSRRVASVAESRPGRFCGENALFWGWGRKDNTMLLAFLKLNFRHQRSTPFSDTSQIQTLTKRVGEPWDGCPKAGQPI